MLKTKLSIISSQFEEEGLLHHSGISNFSGPTAAAIYVTTTAVCVSMYETQA